MKKLLLLLALLFASITCSSSKSYEFKHEKVNGNDYCYIIDSSYRMSNSDAWGDILIHLLGERGNIENFKTGPRLGLFKEKIAFLESSGNYSIVNQFGYLGKYQFSKRTLAGLGFSLKDINRFILDRNLQEKAMDKLIIHNLSILENYGLMQYLGKQVYGVKITVEGMLAGAHLLGPYAVKRFINYGEVGRDGNGTTIVKYLNEFV